MHDVVHAYIWRINTPEVKEEYQERQTTTDWYRKASSGGGTGSWLRFTFHITESMRKTYSLIFINIDFNLLIIFIFD